MVKLSAIITATTLIIILSGCTKENIKIDLPGSLFTHEIPGCITSDKFEINCTEWITFNNDHTADLLIGGGDVVYRNGYELENNTISLKPEHMNENEPEFQVIDNNTLELVQYDGNMAGTIWVRTIPRY